MEQFDDDFYVPENKLYTLSPSIITKRTIDGKNYVVHSYFRGGKHFAHALENLAVKQAYDDIKKI